MSAGDALLPLALVLASMLAVMATAWLTQRAVRDTGWVDVFWTFGSGAMLALAALWPSDAALPERQWLAAAVAVVWAGRLGVYVASRVAKGPEDSRYAQLRRLWGADYQRRLFGFVLIQAPATTLLALSVFTAAHAGEPTLGWRDLIAVLILAIGIGGEALADEQMRRFKATPGHGPIMDQGLWSWSRHPNYFFQWFGWLAWPVMALDLAEPFTLTTLVAPAVMYLILRHGSGVPPLERTMLESRGETFRDYQSRVSVFFPLPPRRVRP
ncbi:DUF1295 domain-containing protein [Brevundimonas sp. 2R-24]|uniref:DUF1295 domain-containing protein n=1 Tax=Peiella sedimenti TaxID=3061083 RepID=A0ABT8SK85_9CAUL|nr:DUF1295 domain-containing protein [Caulobacteraceae bacterium XZ-24]